MSSMTPSGITPITQGQMGKFYDVLVAALTKSGLPSEPTQLVLERQGAALADEFVAALQKRVDAISDMITRQVTVDGTRTPQAALDATGRIQYTDKKVVASMPDCESGTRTVCLFKLSRFVSDEDLAKEYELRGLVSAPREQAALNEADAAFADQYPNGTHWKDKDGNWCFAAFGQWRDGERVVSVGRRGGGWSGHWWFVGVGK